MMLMACRLTRDRFPHMDQPPSSPSARLPVREKIAWGMGGFSDQVATNGLNSLFVPIYNIGFGMSSVLIGWAAAIPRLIDTLSDPVMGNISDNSRSRFGRRRPFVLAGAFLMALGFGLSYMASPYWGSAALFAFAVATGTFFYLMYTIFSVPYNALGLELTSDYDERADVQKYRMILASAASFGVPWLYKICLSTGELVRGYIESGKSAWYGFVFQPMAQMAADDSVKIEVLGIRYVAWSLAVVVLVTGTSLFLVANSSPVSFYSAWLTNYPTLSNTNGTADPDGDGFDNDLEFAFDGNPTFGTASLLTVTQNGSNAVFNFVASTNPASVLYTVQATTNLSTSPWADDIGVTASVTNSANQTNPPILLAPEYVRREFSLPATNKSFYRVKATIAP